MGLLSSIIPLWWRREGARFRRCSTFLTGSTKIDLGKSQNFFLMLMPLVLVPFTILSFRCSLLPTSKQSIPGSLWAPFQMIRSTKTQALISIYDESKELWGFEKDRETRNPVIEGSEFAYKVDQLLLSTWMCMFKISFIKATNLVQINDDGVKIAAKHVSASDKLRPFICWARPSCSMCST